MSRVVTMQEDGSSAHLTAIIEEFAGERRVTSLTLSAGPGEWLVARDVAMLTTITDMVQSDGGDPVRRVVTDRLPAPALLPAAVPAARRPAARKATARKATAAKPPRQRTAGSTPAVTGRSKRPGDDELVAMAQQVDGSGTALAAHYDIPRNTAYSWLKDLRRRGLIGYARNAGALTSA